VEKHLANEPWYDDYFTFVSDVDLRIRLAEEFKAARYIYKILEGLAANGWLLTAQVKLQVLLYASIYEAALHHLLFDRCAALPEVHALMYAQKHKRISVSKELDNLVHDGKQIITMYRDLSERDLTKVRFDEKVRAAISVGLIDQTNGDDLIEVYETRNAIHLHAELRKQIKYTISMSTVAYRRMQPFREQIIDAISRFAI
jgi:hypothetical protein